MGTPFAPDGCSQGSRSYRNLPILRETYIRDPTKSAGTLPLGAGFHCHTKNGGRPKPDEGADWPRDRSGHRFVYRSSEGHCAEGFVKAVQRECVWFRCTHEGFWETQMMSDAILAKAWHMCHNGLVKPIKYHPAYAVRISMKDYHQEEWMTNIPLYAVCNIW